MSPKPTILQRRKLPLMGRIDRYVTSHFVGSYAVALFLVLGLYTVLDMASNLPDYLATKEDGSQASGLHIATYYLMQVPFLFLQVAPFVSLLAGLFTVNRLLKKNEVTAVLAAGISVHRLLVPVLIMGSLLTVGMFGLREFLVEEMATKRDHLLFAIENPGEPYVVDDVHVYDLSSSVVFLKGYHPALIEGDVPWAEGMTAILNRQNRDDAPYVKVESERATWDGSQWVLTNGERRLVEEGVSDVTEVTVLEGFEFDPALVETYRRSRDPLQLSFAEVQQLIQREPEDAAFRTLWHYNLTFPLANLVLLIVGVPLLFQYERGRGSERMALGGLLCVFFFAADFVLRTLGLEGSISPLMACWLPLLVFGSLGVVLFDSMRS
jgi:lipopolysaccharide export system permease protein